MNESEMTTLIAAQESEAVIKRAARTGLTAAEVLEARQQHGENRFPAEKGASAWVILLNQLKAR